MDDAGGQMLGVRNSVGFPTSLLMGETYTI